VTNSSGAVSNIASLTVNAAATSTPAITSLSPNQMTGSNSSQTLTIAGTGFAVGDSVQVTFSGGGITTLQILSLSATQIQASIVTGAISRTWAVTVVNANNVASNSAVLLVFPPPPPTTPVITAVSSLKAANTTQTLTIAGTGFTPGNSLKVIVGYNGYGYYYPVITATATQIQVQIDPGTVARTWEVEVIDSNGAISNVATFQSQ